MKTLKTALLSTLAALGMSGGLYAADGLAQADENGIVPYVWWKFDGDLSAYGTIVPEQNSFMAPASCGYRPTTIFPTAIDMNRTSMSLAKRISFILIPMLAIRRHSTLWAILKATAS